MYNKKTIIRYFYITSFIIIMCSPIIGDRGAESISLEEEWFDIVAAIKLYKRILSLQVL